MVCLGKICVNTLHKGYDDDDDDYDDGDHHHHHGDRGSTVVKVLRYKSEGR
jgi:hypothetical protein